MRGLQGGAQLHRPRNSREGDGMRMGLCLSSTKALCLPLLWPHSPPWPCPLFSFPSGTQTCSYTAAKGHPQAPAPEPPGVPTTGCWLTQMRASPLLSLLSDLASAPALEGWESGRVDPEVSQGDALSRAYHHGNVA